MKECVSRMITPCQRSTRTELNCLQPACLHACLPASIIHHPSPFFLAYISNELNPQVDLRSMITSPRNTSYFSNSTNLVVVVVGLLEPKMKSEHVRDVLTLSS
jgi:hypothetical protein